MLDSHQVRGPFDGSIKIRLPLLMAALLAATVGLFGWVSYREVERAFVESSRHRMEAMARQLASLFAQSAQPRLDEVRRLAGHASMRALVMGGDGPAADAVRRDATALLAANPQNIAIDVWTAAGSHVLTVIPSTRAPVPVPARLVAPQTTGFSPFRAAGSVISYDVVAAIVPDAEAGPTVVPIGFVVLHRRASAVGAAAIIGQLVGSDVTVEFGSQQGGIWSNLSNVTPAPPAAALKARNAAPYIDARGVQRLGTAAPIGGTPWSVWVSSTRDQALGPVRSFLQRMFGLGLGVVLAGAAVGWVLARRVTRPLVKLTAAAEALAAGDLSQRVEASQPNEVGRLGRAFNTMADHVADGYARLDARVEERTQALESTLRALEEAQEALVRREKLAMLGQLASGVGHELRNPLGVMTNAVYYLELVQPDAPTEVHEYHGILRSQIGLAERIVGDLLDFARIRPPQRQQVLLDRLLDEQLVRLGAPSGIAIERDIPAGLPLADVDPMQVGQIVLNLLLNAVQAIDGTGGVLTLRGRPTGAGVALDVLDTGPGVAPELQEKIFEALFTTRARGIGLGLAVSRSLAVANGGSLTVDTAPAGGAMFTLTLPAVPVASLERSE